MNKGHTYPVIVLMAVLLLASCGGKGGRWSDKAYQQEAAGQEADLQFRSLNLSKGPEVPSVITDRKEISEYVVSHFWDAFFDGEYVCDSSHINGVSSDEVEKAIGMFVTLLENNCPREFSEKTMSGFFSQVEHFSKDHPGSNAYSFFEKEIPKYLYDPNSPVRDEDLYRPYASGLASSELTDENMKSAYAFEAEMSLLNRVGSVASDFTFTDLAGKKHSLHGIKADYTLLMFTNPGCENCKETINSLVANSRITQLVKSGAIVVANIYIDLEREKWQELAKEYPSDWLNGYDQDYLIRQNRIYNVRGIPSLYVLDSDKKVLMKDAPVEKAIPFLMNIQT